MKSYSTYSVWCPKLYSSNAHACVRDGGGWRKSISWFCSALSSEIMQLRVVGCSYDDSLWRRLDFSHRTLPAGALGNCVLNRGCEILKLANSEVRQLLVMWILARLQWQLMFVFIEGLQSGVHQEITPPLSSAVSRPVYGDNEPSVPHWAALTLPTSEETELRESHSDRWRY